MIMRSRLTALITSVLIIASLITLATVPNLRAVSASVQQAPPTTIKVGDSEWVNLTYDIYLSNVTSTNPTVAFILTIAGIDPTHFSYSKIKYEVLIKHEGALIDNATNSASLSTNSTSELIQLSMYYTSSVPYTNFNLVIKLSIKALSTYGFTDSWNYRLVVSSGSQAYLLTKEGSISVNVYAKPPSVTLITLQPTPPVMAPKTLANVSLLVSDASKVKNVSIEVIKEGTTTPITKWVNTSVSLYSYLTPTITLNTSTWSLGNYSIVVRACDEANVCGSNNVATLIITKVFEVPSIYFSNLTQLIKHPGFLPGSEALVVSDFKEAKSVVIDKANVTIEGRSLPTITISADKGFIIEASNVTIKGIKVVCNNIAFYINKTEGVVIDSVQAVASRFIEVNAPISTVTYWRHVVKDSTLNGEPVAYLVGGGSLSNSTYAEAHLLFGTYSLNSTTINNLYSINSTLNLYDTKVSKKSTLFTNESIYWSLIVKVTFAGKPVPGATVSISNNMTSARLTTGSEGTVKYYVIYEKYINGSLVARANETTIEASKFTLRNSTKILINEPKNVTLALPAPKVKMMVTAINGTKVVKAVPGELLNVSVSTTISIPYRIELQVILNSTVISDVLKYTAVPNNEFIVATPYSKGTMELVVNVIVGNLPPITLTSGSMEVSR